MTVTQDTTPTQLDKALASLTGMKVNITDTDRSAAMKSFKTTTQTITNYLNGKGRSLDTAVKLIQFFRKRIEDREKLISC